MTEEELRRYAFERATNGFSGSARRWAERARTGLTDDQLRDALKMEIGIGGSCGGDRPVLDFNGLTIKAGFRIGHERVVLQGERTVKYARDFYQIPNPDNPQGALL